MSESLGISIQTMCYQCQALTELCPDCQELRDSRDINIAHQIVDEGNLQYKFVWFIQSDDPSGHDWTDRDDEFLPPISQLADRLFDLETSLTTTTNEVLCKSCHLIYNKYQADCPVCY
jgi:hypothetical protein